MDKLEALVVLIRASTLLPDEKKEEIIDAIPRMTAEEIETMGTFLAGEHKDNLEAGDVAAMFAS